MQTPTNTGIAVTRWELAEMLGVTRQGARHISEQDTFPAPFDVCREGREPLWWRSSVERWMKEKGRERRTKKSTKGAK